MEPTQFHLLHEVFNQRGLILAFFGALGGSVRAAVLKTTWKEGLRVIFVGGAVSFGVGVLAPFLLRPWVGDLPYDMAGTLGTLTAAAFLIGLMSVTLIERLIAGEPVIQIEKEEEVKPIPVKAIIKKEPPKLITTTRKIKKVENVAIQS